MASVATSGSGLGGDVLGVTGVATSLATGDAAAGVMGTGGEWSSVRFGGVTCSSAAALCAAG